MKQSTKKSGTHTGKSKTDKTSNNQEKSKQSKFWIFFESTVVTAILLGTLGYFWNTYTAFRSTMFDKYDKLIKSVELLVFLDEVLFLLCEESKKITVTDCACKYNLEILNYRKDLIKQFEHVTDSVRSLGKFLPYENYFQVKQLVYWTDQAILSKEGICTSGLLVDSQKMDRWRFQIIGNLVKEKIRYRKPLYSLEAYFINIFTVRISERHVSGDIDLKNLPIYQNP